MNMENIPSEIFDLLVTKSFEMLSSDEQQIVLQHMSQSDYDESRTAILSFKEVDHQINFDERTLPKQEIKSSPIIRFVNYRIPVYQVAAGLALMAMVTYGVNNYNSGIDDISKPRSYSGQSVAYGNYPDSLVFNL